MRSINISDAGSAAASELLIRIGLNLNRITDNQVYLDNHNDIKAQVL